MDYKLLVLDIDGTATNSQKEVTPVTRDAVIRLQKTGVPVAIASGRPVPGVAPVADSFSFEEYGSYALCYNGAKIINWKTKECVYSKTLPEFLPRQLYQDACQYNTGILTYLPDDSGIICGSHIDEYMQLESRICNIPIISGGEGFVSKVSFPVTKCLLTGNPDDIERLEPLIAKKYRHEANIFRSEPFYLEIMPKNVDKAYCLSKLLNILGIGREEIVCCGDSYNDITMIQYAGMGVAMANAKPEVKDVANCITRSNDDDGIAYVIYNLWPDLL